MMKIGILFGMVASLAASSAFAAPAKHCIKTPTITCESGYYPNEVEGCWSCAPEEQQREPLCVKAPTIECAPTFVVKEDANGCFRCVKP